jgi:hypothetical protein
VIGQLASYPYLGTALLLWLAALVCIIAWTGQRRSLWLIALLGAPFGIYSFEFIPQYWDPRVVLWLGACSLEDLLFATSTGVIAWTLAAAGWLRVRRPAQGWIGRFGLVYALGVGVGYILTRGGTERNVILSYYNTGQRYNSTPYQRKVERYITTLEQLEAGLHSADTSVQQS